MSSKLQITVKITIQIIFKLLYNSLIQITVQLIEIKTVIRLQESSGHSLILPLLNVNKLDDTSSTTVVIKLVGIIYM